MSSKRMKLHEEDYADGSIIRIRLDDFMTYECLEFRPGPSLNVIIGPNGTGKSTIVCAICIGLAGKPSYLGRQLQPAEFIRNKSKTDKAIIEIELKNADGENYVIRREIHRDNTSKWAVNQRNASQRTVEDLVSRLNIQVGNLCQFLPQDKVADFAKMSQQELLESTEKAVGPPGMYEKHQELNAARVTERTLQSEMSRSQQQLEQEKTQNERIHNDVTQYKDRQRRMEKIKNLKMKLPLVEYEEKKKEYETARDMKKEEELKLAKAKSQNAPLQKQIENAVKMIREVDAKMKKMGEGVKDNARKATDCNKSIENQNELIQEIKDELAQKKQEEVSRKQKLRDFSKQLQGLELELGNLQEGDIQPALDEVNHEMSQLAQQMTRTNQQAETVKMKYNNAKREVTSLQAEIRELNNRSNQRLELLRRKHKDTYDAVQWLRANRELFRGQIHEPMMLLINVNDPSKAKYVEQHISFNDMKAFVVEDNDDMDLFMKHVRQDQRLKVNAVIPPPGASAVVNPHQPITNLQAFGFHTYLRELFDCPDLVMRYLCHRYNVHQIPVGNAYTKSHVQQAVGKLNLNLFYTENHQYTVRKSKYSQNTSSRCTELKPPSLLNINTNNTRETELKDELKTKQLEMRAHETEYRQLEKSHKDMETKMNSLRNKKKELMAKKNERRQLVQKINMKKDSINRIESEALDLEAEETNTHRRISGILTQKLRLLKELQQHTKMCQKLSQDKLEQSLLYAYHVQQHKQYEQQLREQSDTLRTLEREVEKHKEFVKQLKNSAMKLLAIARRVTGLNEDLQLPEKIKQAFEILPSTVEKIEAAIHEEQARADCTYQTDESVVREYEEREELIRRLMEESVRRENSVQQHREKIEETRVQWLEPLNELLGKINENFGYFFRCMKCVGEVDLNIPENPEDYEKYGIRIKVMFRDNEQLRELTPHQQSGGERSVATVLYMMALQELTRVPFRCVDEINQGMDPQNERKVFELVVNTACTKSTSQYFLLTPKLLPGLQYSARMTVLCVYSGPNMMRHTEWDINKFIRRRAKLE